MLQTGWIGFVWRIFAFGIGSACCDCMVAIGFVWRRRGLSIWLQYFSCEQGIVCLRRSDRGR